ncbi:uncharacterized protein LOC110731834 [Chenopodium quinoa]|uniref:uncharacterized protein LOC110731834 n=1 Tax=Chenopodium quinoa TaxID=63459 RepID=UPI000B782415|nr:uncharacterized protein LOC110731834 [Chenopodium quinoa]
MLGYHGVKLPAWAIDNNMVKSLPFLVKLHLEDCKDLEQVPRLGKLQNLKVLSLLSLEKLEYIEEDDPQASVSGLLTAEEPPYFPSLEQLWLKNLLKLKGWMKSGVELDDVRLSQLNSLVIDKCPELTWIPQSPILEDLTVYSFNERLMLMRIHEVSYSPPSSPSYLNIGIPSSSQSIDPGSSSNSYSSNVLKLIKGSGIRQCGLAKLTTS